MYENVTIVELTMEEIDVIRMGNKCALADVWAHLCAAAERSHILFQVVNNTNTPKKIYYGSEPDRKKLVVFHEKYTEE